MARVIEYTSPIQGRSLTPSGVSTFSSDFPVAANAANAIVAMHLLFKVTTVNGTTTPSGPITDGLLRLIQGITFRGALDGEMVVSPARPLHARACFLSGGEPPLLDAPSTTAGTFSCYIPIHFADPRTVQAEDTMIDIRRQRSFTLEIAMGGVDKLFTTPGTVTYTATLDLVLEMTDRPLSGYNGQRFAPFLASQPSAPVGDAKLNLTNSGDLSVKRLFFLTTNNADAWQGDSNITSVVRWSIVDGSGAIGLSDDPEALNRARKQLEYSVNAPATQQFIDDMYWVDYMLRTGSLFDAQTANRSEFRLKWQQTTSPPSGATVHCFVDGIKRLKWNLGERRASTR